MFTNKDSSMKQTNPFQMRIDTIRQKTNSKWKQFSIIYSKFLIRFPWSILAISSFISIGLTVCCLLLMHTRPFDQNDFLMSNGPALKNAFHIKEIFGNDTELRVHQQLKLYPGLDIIIKRKSNTNQTNMLDNDVIREIHLLDKLIQSIRINNTITYDYPSLCIRVDHACIIDGNYMLTEQFRQAISNLHPPAPPGYYFDPSSGANGVPSFMFGKNYHVTNATPIVSDYDDSEENKENVQSSPTTETPLEKIISYAPLLRLRYSLNVSTPEMHQLAIEWERKVLRYLNEEYESLLIDIFPSTSTAIPDVITKKAHEEGLYMSVMILIFVILFCLLISIQGNFHTSVGYLPICGIISIALSTGATFGLLAIFRVQIIEPMALLVFIVAIVDCMRISIVCGEYHRTIAEHLIPLTDSSSKIDIEKILPSIIESTHPYFLISTLIISLTYSLFSIYSPMLSTMLICLTLALYLLINYILHSTFFSSCLVITLKRVSSHRHCLFCVRLSNDYYIKSNKKLNKLRLLKQQIYSLLNIDSIWKKFFTAILCLSLIIFVISSIWFGLSIDTRLYEDKLLPRDAYSLRKYMQIQIDEFDVGPVIMFVIPKSINYENEQIKSAIYSLLNQCHNQTNTNTFTLLWSEHETVSDIINRTVPLSVRITPVARNDLIVQEGLNHSTIIASRFYCQYKSIQGDRDDIRTMNNIYIYASHSRIPFIFPYSLVFPNYESLGQIRLEMYLLILLLIICSLFGTFISFFSLKNSLLIISNILALLTGTLTCLYLFHNLTFNFANALWLYVVPIIFLDTLIHSCYQKFSSKWKYNRIILSLIISLLVLYIFPIQSYVFQIIRNSLIYQSIICLILINFVLPSWFYLFQSINKTEQVNKVIQPRIISDGNQSLTNGTEVKNTIYDSYENSSQKI